MFHTLATVNWPRRNSALHAFHAGIDAFVNKHLPSNPPSAPEGKSVADPILGYIHLSALEMAFIDTELFQRLRRIRQVGLAYLIYPSLGYARFEHTLGALGVLNKVLDRLKQVHSHRPTKRPDIVEKINDSESALRIAVLFHDVGHCLFSHVSERVLRELPGLNRSSQLIQSGMFGVQEERSTLEVYPSSKAITSEYKKTFRKELAPAEILSIAILTSPRIQAWIDRILFPSRVISTEYGTGAPPLATQTDELLRCAAFLIAGAPIDETNIFLSQLLSSALDVDKLDYMQRDAFYSGIAVGIDFVRLLDKMRVFKLNSPELPADLIFAKKLGKGPFEVLGVSHGGQFAFEEFCLARASLYDKIYLHQKVRNVESHLATLLTPLMEQFDEFKMLHHWLYLSESIIDHDTLPIHVTQRDNELFKTENASFLRCDGFRKRILLERSFAMGIRNSLSEPIMLVPDNSITLGTMIELGEHSKGFVKKIRTEASEICARIKQALHSDLFKDIIFDTPDHRRVSQRIQSIYVKQPTLLPLRWALPIDRVTDYYRTRAVSYIYARPEVCAIVALATERIVFEQYGLAFEQREFLNAGTVAAINNIRAQLAETGYYDSAPGLKPKSIDLTSAAGEEAIAEIVNNLMEFTPVQGPRVTPASITQYVMQFPAELHASVLELLRRVRLVRPLDIVKSVLKKAKETTGGRQLIAPIGNLRDSAAHLSYYMKSLPELNDAPLEIEEISDISVPQSDSIVLFDDNLNSTKQSLNIFAQWLGVKLPSEYLLKESRHVRALSAEARAKFLSLPITLVYGVAPEWGREQLVSHLTTLCEIPKDNISVHVLNELLMRERPLSGDKPIVDNAEEVKRTFLEIGTSLLLSELDDNEEAAKSKALGYAGTEALVVFPYNVPTMTLTALWCPGVYRNRPWIPLLWRRRSSKPNLSTGQTSNTNALI